MVVFVAFGFTNRQRDRQIDPTRETLQVGGVLSARIWLRCVSFWAFFSGPFCLPIGQASGYVRDGNQPGAQLLQAGMQMVLAMGYSVTVSAAERLMTTLYQQLHAGASLAEGIRRGRAALWNEKGRQASFNQTIELSE